MMVEAEATEHASSWSPSGATAPTEEVVAAGLEAAKPAIRELCRAQAELAEVAAKPVAEFPVFLDYEDDVFAAVEAAVSEEVAEALKIAAQGRTARRRSTGSRQGRAEQVGDAVRGPGEGDLRARSGR